MRPTTRFRGYLTAAPALVLLSGLTSPIAAQPPDVAINPVVETDAVHPGTTAYVALAVTLDPGFHVNSNTPLDDLLIPTVLTLDPPAGISLEAVAFPEAILLEQVGAEQPLAVFEEEFRIGAALLAARRVEVESLITGVLPIAETPAVLHRASSDAAAIKLHVSRR